MCLNRPMRKMTARSYSATTLKQMNNEIGNVIIINSAEQISETISMHVEMLPRAENSKGDKKIYGNILWIITKCCSLQSNNLWLPKSELKLPSIFLLHANCISSLIHISARVRNLIRNMWNVG